MRESHPSLPNQADDLRKLLTNEIAKHLDQLKGGRFPIEVLVRGKDAAENEKLFVTVAEKIKEAGVSY